MRRRTHASVGVRKQQDALLDTSSRRFQRAGKCTFVICALLVTLCILTLSFAGKETRTQQLSADANTPIGVLPGEFEHQAAILLAWPREAKAPFPADAIELFRRQDQVLCDLVQTVCHDVPVIILIQDDRTQDRVTRLLSQLEVPADAIRFVQVPFHTAWIRDYGPIAVTARDGSNILIDTDYVDSWDLVNLKPYNDRLPLRVGAELQLQTIRAPIAIQQGNLLSNGQGLCIATRKLLADNAARGYDADEVLEVLKKYFGVTALVLLEELHGEQTGHVDIFATVDWVPQPGMARPECDFGHRLRPPTSRSTSFSSSANPSRKQRHG